MTPADLTVAKAEALLSLGYLAKGPAVHAFTVLAGLVPHVDQQQARRQLVEIVRFQAQARSRNNPEAHLDFHEAEVIAIALAVADTDALMGRNQKEAS